LKKKIPKIKNIGSIKAYKENINLLTHFVLYEEEGIVWNNDVLEYLKKLNILFNKDRNNFSKNFIKIYRALLKFDVLINGVQVEPNELIVSAINNFYKFKFTKEINIGEILVLEFNEMYSLNLNILDINFNDKEYSLLEHCLILIDDLEFFSMQDIANSRYSFLFDVNDEKKIKCINFFQKWIEWLVCF